MKSNQKIHQGERETREGREAGSWVTDEPVFLTNKRSLRLLSLSFSLFMFYFFFDFLARACVCVCVHGRRRHLFLLLFYVQTTPKEKRESSGEEKMNRKRTKKSKNKGEDRGRRFNFDENSGPRGDGRDVSRHPRKRGGTTTNDFHSSFLQLEPISVRMLKGKKKKDGTDDWDGGQVSIIIIIISKMFVSNLSLGRVW